MPYSIKKTKLSDVLLLEPRVYGDDRGYFFESYNHRDFQEATKLNFEFVQDNHSRSEKKVLRGLHYQIKYPQGKLVRVVQGTVYDVAVDLRQSSPNYGNWMGEVLSAENKRQLWIPPGFAHGFVVISDTAEFLYKTTEYWRADFERILKWNDPTVAIDWPIDFPPTLSERDSEGEYLSQLSKLDIFK